MKKVISCMVITAMLMVMMFTVASAAHKDIGLLKVLYTDSGKISVDGEKCIGMERSKQP